MDGPAKLAWVEVPTQGPWTLGEGGCRPQVLEIREEDARPVLAGDAFVLVGKGRNRAKVLWFDGRDQDSRLKCIAADPA